MDRYEVEGRTFEVGQVVACWVSAREQWVNCRVLPHLARHSFGVTSRTVRVQWWYEPGSACGGPNGKWGHAYFFSHRVRTFPHQDFA